MAWIKTSMLTLASTTTTNRTWRKTILCVKQNGERMPILWRLGPHQHLLGLSCENLWPMFVCTNNEVRIFPDFILAGKLAIHWIFILNSHDKLFIECDVSEEVLSTVVFSFPGPTRLYWINDVTKSLNEYCSLKLEEIDTWLSEKRAHAYNIIYDAQIRENALYYFHWPWIVVTIRSLTGVWLRCVTLFRCRQQSFCVNRFIFVVVQLSLSLDACAENFDLKSTRMRCHTACSQLQ